MIDYRWDTTPIIGAKLQEIKVKDNEFILLFDNGRTLTVLLSLSLSKTSLEPKAEFICGYNNKAFKKEDI